MASPEEIARYKALRSERLGLGTPEAQAPTGQASQAADPSTMSYQDYRKARLGGAQNIRHYSDLPEEKQRFMEEDWGLLDALGVLARPQQAIFSGYEGYKKGEDIGQIGERVKTELLTPYGIEGSKEVIKELMPGQWEDTTMEEVAARRGPSDPDQTWYEGLGQFMSDAYDAADPIDWVSFGTDVAADPLWVATPAKAGAAIGKAAKPVGALAKAISPKTVELMGRVARENNITLALEKGFAGTDYMLNKIVKRGGATSDDVLRAQDELALAHGKSNRALDEALKMEMGYDSLGLKEIQFRAVAHAMEKGQGRGKFIENPVARHVMIAGEEVPITKDMMTVAKDVAKMKDELRATMVDEGINVGFVENFVHHYFPEKKQSWVRNFFLDEQTAMDSRAGGIGGGVGKASFEHARKPGSTLAKLQKQGLQPEDDIRKIATKYYLEVHHTLASRNLMKFAEEKWGMPITGLKDVERVARKKNMALYTAKGRFIEGGIPQKKTGAMAKVLEDDGSTVIRAIKANEVETYLSEGNKVFALPREMGEVLNRHFGAFSEAGRAEIGGMFKRYNSWWKSYALLSGGFHIRNAYGGVFQNYLSGMVGPKSALHYKNSVRSAAAALGDPAKMQATLSKTKVPGMKNKTVWDLWDEASSRGWVDTTTIHSEHLGRATRGTARRVFTQKGRKTLTGTDVAKMILPTQENALVQASRGLGNSVENSLRFALYMDRRAKGDSIIQAGKKVVRTHFDYRYGLTPFEKGIRDNAVPFYSWLRFNVPFQLDNLYRQPAKYSMVPKMVHAISGNETATEERYKPGYFRELGLFKIPNSENEEGFSNYFFPDMPFKDIMTAANIAKPLTAWMAGEEPNEDHLAEIGREIMQNAGPIPKVTMEMMTGYNFFQKRQLSPREYEPFPSSLIWLPDAVKSRIGGKETAGKWTMHKGNINAIEALAPLIGKIDRMFPAQQSRTEEHGNAVLSILLGWKTYHHNLDKHRRWAMAARKQEREEARAVEQGQIRAAKEMQMNSPYEGFEKETPLIQEQIMNLLQ